MPAALVGGGCVVALSIAQALPIALKKVRGSAAGKAVANTHACTKVRGVVERVAHARDNAIAQGIAHPEIFADSEIFSYPEIFSDPEAFPNPQTDSGTEA